MCWSYSNDKSVGCARQQSTVGTDYIQNYVLQERFRSSFSR